MTVTSSDSSSEFKKSSAVDQFVEVARGHYIIMRSVWILSEISEGSIFSGVEFVLETIRRHISGRIGVQGVMRFCSSSAKIRAVLLEHTTALVVAPNRGLAVSSNTSGRWIFPAVYVPAFRAPP